MPLDGGVRFIDNFSTGTRGAMCTQEFLAAGYSVVFLYREGSNFPFLTQLVQSLRADPVGLLAGASPGDGGQLRVQAGAGGAPPEHLAARLLAVPFTTIFEYLFFLRATCTCLQKAGPAALIFLAAAVSDFYIPEKEMATEKIQSRSNDGHTVQLRNVPKLLGQLKVWAPDATLISFKLETNANILIAKAAGAIVKYGVDAVCSNMLANHRELVTIVSKDPAAQVITIAKEAIAGDEAEPIAVEGISCQRVPRGDHAFIDRPLVEAVVAIHARQLPDSCAGDAAKRPRL